MTGQPTGPCGGPVRRLRIVPFGRDSHRQTGPSIMNDLRCIVGRHDYREPDKDHPVSASDDPDVWAVTQTPVGRQMTAFWSRASSTRIVAG